jgi:hypothetical protein
MMPVCESELHSVWNFPTRPADSNTIDSNMARNQINLNHDRPTAAGGGNAAAGRQKFELVRLLNVILCARLASLYHSRTIWCVFDFVLRAH